MSEELKAYFLGNFGREPNERDRFDREVAKAYQIGFDDGVASTFKSTIPALPPEPPEEPTV